MSVTIAQGATVTARNFEWRVHPDEARRAAPVRVALLDSQPLVREGVRLLIEREDDLDVVEQWSTLAEIRPSPADPQVVVTDLVLPDGSGGGLVAWLRQELDADIVVLTAAKHPTDVHDAMAAGARGYVLRTAAPGDLVRGIRAAARGETYLQPALAEALARRDESGKEGRGIDHLTSREEAVLRALALGYTHREIAERLGVSLRTVEGHRAALARKLGPGSRARLVQLAREAGLTELPAVPAPTPLPRAAAAAGP
jgi:DNA-binding NarL/FixJ family response regulator